jgi:8-oxo-dGTP pyrophosphatase MutT (NUDIX family)
MPVENKGDGCYHVHNTTTKKCLSKKKANKQLAAIEIAKHMHEAIMEMFEPNRSPIQNSSYMSTTEDQHGDDSEYESEFDVRDNDVPEGSPYWGRKAAGCLFYALSTGNVLFALRSDKVMEPNTWAGFGGKVDGAETPIEALERELDEEAGFVDMADYIGVSVFEDPEHDFEYYNYLVLVKEEFNPTLNQETSGFKWTRIETPPTPLHPGLTEAMPYYVAAVRKIQNEKA